MFFFAMEEMLVPCRPFDHISRLPGTCSGSRQCPACMSRGWFCVCVLYSYCHYCKRFTELLLYLIINSECPHNNYY